MSPLSSPLMATPGVFEKRRAGSKNASTMARTFLYLLTLGSALSCSDVISRPPAIFVRVAELTAGWR